jgi:hypothetical protein
MNYSIIKESYFYVCLRMLMYKCFKCDSGTSHLKRRDKNRKHKNVLESKARTFGAELKGRGRNEIMPPDLKGLATDIDG